MARASNQRPPSDRQYPHSFVNPDGSPMSSLRSSDSLRRRRAAVQLEDDSTTTSGNDELSDGDDDDDADVSDAFDHTDDDGGRGINNSGNGRLEANLGSNGQRLTADERLIVRKQEQRFRTFLERQNRILAENSANLFADLLPMTSHGMPPIPGYSESYDNTALSAASYTNYNNDSHVGTTTSNFNINNINNSHSASATNTAVPSRMASPKPVVSERNLKGLISPAQNVAHMVCKALSLPPSLYGVWVCLHETWKLKSSSDFSSMGLELLLAALWGGVSAYLSFAFIDGLMLRWLVMYSSPATIVRLLSINALMTALIKIILDFFARDPANLLATWILIACVLTAAYAIQNFVTSNIAIEPRARRVDLYNIAVFAVVPVGFASFITMIGLIRSLVVVRAQQ